MPTCHAISGSRFNPLVTRRYPVLRLAVVVLVAIWALAVFTKHTMGGFAHVLLVFALVLGLIHLVRGNTP